MRVRERSTGSVALFGLSFVGKSLNRPATYGPSGSASAVVGNANGRLALCPPFEGCPWHLAGDGIANLNKAAKA